MSECPVCGDLDYQEVAGHFYCTTCNTQSQDVRVMEVDQDSVISSFISLSQTPSIKKKKQTKIPPPRKVNNIYRPWSVYEGYAVILKKQVEALIELGAKPELKDIVFKIWANYLALAGVAFTDQNMTKKLLEYAQNRKEGRYPILIGGRKRNHKEEEKHVRKKQKKRKDTGRENSDEDLENRDESDDLEFSFSEESEEGEDSEDSSYDKEVKMMTLRQEANKHRRTDYIFTMHLSVTLCLCYLGLMETNPLTTICDLIRWAKQAKVPYSEPKDMLPPEMQIYTQACGSFPAMQVVPSRELMRKKIVHISHYLGLTERSAYQFPLLQLIHKYIFLLDLPADLHACAVVLVERTQGKANRSMRFAFWEGIAMAYIVVMLKLLFGINDRSERVFSSYSRDLNKLYYGGEEKLFVWDRWLAHVADKIEKLDTKVTKTVGKVVAMATEMIELLTQPRFRVNLKSIQKRESSKLIDDEVYAEVVHRRMKRRVGTNKERLLDPGYRNALQKPLLELVEKWIERGKRDQGDNSSSTVDEMGYSHRGSFDNDTLGLMIGMYDEEEILPEFSSLSGSTARVSEEQLQQHGETFRKSSLKHILDPKDFVKQHEKEEADNAKKQEESGSRGSVDNDNQKDGHASESQKDRHDPEELRYSKKDRFMNVLKHYDYIKEHYYLTSSEKRSAEESVSYKWLIHLFSRFTYAKQKNFKKMVDSLERQIKTRAGYYIHRKKQERKWLGQCTETDV